MINVNFNFQVFLSDYILNNIFIHLEGFVIDIITIQNIIITKAD